MSSSTWELKEIGPEWDARWDALAAAAPESGFMQSSAWRAFKRAEGYLTPRWGLFEAGELKGGAGMLSYPAYGNEGFLICPDGPLLPWDDLPRARAGLRCLLAAAQEWASQHGGLGLRIEPRLTPPRPSLLRNGTRAPVDLNPIHSLMLDLTLSEAEIKAQMRPKSRYNLKLAERHGVQIIRSEQMQDLPVFYSLFRDTAGRQDFFSEPYGFFLNLSAALFPCRMAELFLANWQGETLAALLIVYFGGRATYLYGGSTNRHRNVMPTYALHWAAMQAARERGCVEYDLYGYDPFEQPDHLYAGFSRFKRQLGGKRVDTIGAWDFLFYDRLAETLAGRLAHA